MTRHVEPAKALAGEGKPVLDAAEVRSWRERGFALVDGVFPEELLARARRDADRVFPPPGSVEGEAVTDFGSGGRLEFPSESEAVNELTLHPRLLGAVSQLLDVPVLELRLTQSDLWAKYARAGRAGGDRDNTDQRIHVDYPNHTLTHPPPWHEPEVVEILVYLSDVEDCGGATALVPRAGRDDPAYAWPIVRTPGVAGLPWRNDREAAEADLAKRAPDVARFRAEHLYPRELRARYRTGSVLFYRHDLWHRGTPLLPGARRLAQNLTFRRAGAEWISVLQPGWAWAMYRPRQTMERLIATASVEQRTVLGFPAPGAAYWTRETVAAVGARYRAYGMDMTPYEEALAR